MTSTLWHPFTQAAISGPPMFIERAEGVALYGKNDERIIDAISSWWVNIYGHNNPYIVKAVQQQAEKLDQVIFAGFTHGPAEKLAAKLLEVMPSSLQHVFLSDSGSTAVEVALKMAIGAHAHNGQIRKRIVALEHGYHGDTFGAMAVGAPSVFNDIYANYLFSVDRLPFPAQGKEQETIATFENLINTHCDDIAALILEPLLLGAGGMLMYSPQVLKQLKTLCEQNGIYLIADEVMTGFGRTGSLLACSQADVVPDIVCLSKGLTGGFLPLGATMSSAEIYQAFYSTDRAKTFWHSSSYTGNPLACAAAVASIELWQKAETQASITKLCLSQLQKLEELKHHALVENIRCCGTILAFEIKQDDAGYLSTIGPELYAFFMKNGVLLRPLGNTIYIMPPYCIDDADLNLVVSVIQEALDALQNNKLGK